MDKPVRYTIFALALLASVSALLPWYSHHLGNRALKQAEQGRAVESLHLAKKAAAYDPLSIDALFILAGAQQRLGRAAEARGSLQRAVELQPQNFMTWQQLALYENERGSSAAARNHLDKALELNRFDPQLRQLAADHSSSNSPAGQ